MTPSHPPRLLIVDDEPMLLAALRRLFKGFQVTTVTSGADAIELCRSGEVDAVLCDLMMPVVTGPEVYGAVRAQGNGFERRFVFMTGGVFTPAVQEFLASVPNPCVRKPIDIAEVTRLLSAIVST